MLRSTWGAWAMLALVACTRSQAVECEFGTCAPGLACDDIHDLCVLPEQLTACMGLAEDATCPIEMSPSGECADGVCLSQFCGDGVTTHDEACDGAGSMPEVGTCVDFEFDAGPLTCSALCTEGLDGCTRVGWHVRTYPGIGSNRAMWMDGDTLWIANQQGIGRCVGATTCTFEPRMKDHRGVWASGGEVFVALFNGAVARLQSGAWVETTVNPNGALMAIWGRSPNDVYAVGAAGAIFHYTGTWSPMTVPAGTPTLTGVWGTATSVYAVGDAGAGSATILRLSGTTWTAMTAGSSAGVNLRSIWGTDDNDIYAVGVDTATNTGAIFHYTSAGWRRSLPLSAIGPLVGVTGRSRTEVYASSGNGQIWSFDGLSWTSMLKPSTATLGSIHAGATTVFAAGNSDLLLEYSSAGWSESPGRPLVGVDAYWASPSGAQYAIKGCTIYEFDGTGWSTRPLPTCMPCDLSAPPGMQGVTFWHRISGTSSTDVYIGGPYGALMHRDGSGWSCVALPTTVLDNEQPMWTRGIWAASDKNVFVVGNSGDGTVPYLVHYDGQWQDRSPQIESMFQLIWDVWGSSPTDVWAVGSKGDRAVIAHYNGSTWTDVAPPDMKTAQNVWGADGTVFVVGDGIWRTTDGTQWERQPVPEGISLWTTSPYRWISGRSPTDVYVAGMRALLHFDGTNWYPVRRPDVTTIFGVQATPQQIYIASEAGAALGLVGALSR